jgi:hypothetical protein
MEIEELHFFSGLCRGWFTDMKMFHMPCVCFRNRAFYTRDTRALLWLRSTGSRQFGKSYANLTTKSGRRGQWNGLPNHDDSESYSMYLILFILRFVISCNFYLFRPLFRYLPEDFIPSALGRQSDFGHCCLARRASKEAFWKPSAITQQIPTVPNGSPWGNLSLSWLECLLWFIWYMVYGILVNIPYMIYRYIIRYVHLIYLIWCIYVILCIFTHV